jgi:hypothetical protein
MAEHHGTMTESQDSTGESTAALWMAGQVMAMATQAGDELQIEICRIALGQRKPFTGAELDAAFQSICAEDRITALAASTQTQALGACVAVYAFMLGSEED